ncbi:bifunctional UDP-N-acetylglucosamine diphosphorylase/glucosamine-1-phosphate N-acetyltransferase GlmU [Hoyosella rhizosphaerae]|uniref:Bifunctional protein GlmU n=1 Tax=Hoyosella rhizosphaerae TaxID=1755582 RepID=A0A916XFJ5_9ACTN|nr:bifunctional UDP-N-acetylglucosamine diphosphorylase/glucosamine-1-phosphate N-acetyltransferase GlmU [Hoyosella rhizosphaerae]MBN4925725.1 bifunctional UDP-N-acetylglucosamine diphosphorylase/glucosamine-1-phosphate N-acetyltransferase GlmU [Hoyosella rhizosphaerae]GGC68431.1 bifunctional protein GlmU [Hoyosella rhizosphaerae]
MPQTPPLADTGFGTEGGVGAAVIVLAAGAGTRMKSDLPKVLHPLCGRSMLGHALYAAAGVNPSAVVTVVGHQRESVVAEVKHVGEKLDREFHTAVQEEQNGTGHAVGCGLSALPPDFAGTVLVTAGDVPLLTSDALSDLISAHTGQQADNEPAAVTVLTFIAPAPRGYGRIVRDKSGLVAAIVEEADATEDQKRITEVNSGVYAFDAALLRSALSELSSDNAQGELYLTDVIAIARRGGKIVRGMVLDDPHLVAGANDRVQLAGLRKELNRRIAHRLMRDGVNIIDPDTTWIDVDVTIGRDVTVYPGVQLYGATVVGDHAEVGPDTTLTNVEVGAHTRVIRSHAERAIIGSNSVVGPFSYLRPKSVIGDHCKIGAYVETKHAEIGSHSKVPHLTYVGDATIGEHTNIGASSVFVNYDGVNKSRTVVGSHVRAGSDTMFVAPVHVGDGAYTGAGTVVKNDVPSGALAVSGGQQRIIEGWVEKNRPGTASAKAAAKVRQEMNKSPQVIEDGGTE